jgi:hypothetical protein
VPQHVHVIDAVGARSHPGDHAAGLQARVHPARRGDLDMRVDQGLQPGPLSQGHDRDQPGPRHEIRVVKRRVSLARVMRQSHLTGVLSSSATEASVTPIVPAQGAPFTFYTPTQPYLRGGLRLSAGHSTCTAGLAGCAGSVRCGPPGRDLSRGREPEGEVWQRQIV